MKRTSTQAIVIHTTAGNSRNTPEQVQNFFLNILRWRRGGYHTIYAQDGRKREYYDWRTEGTNGILPHGGLNNLNTIHLSYIGGINDRNINEAVCNISPKQEAAMIADIKAILRWFPNAKVLGHNQINQKYCPSFWVPSWLDKHGLGAHKDERDPFRLKELVLRLPHPEGFYTGAESVCEKCGRAL